jgi:Asp-tRNA(Asn)/Glu-tRNA(Gln) amidotransferase A subunit family amidase
MSTTGVHAGCIEDMWLVAIEIARRVGGDPGQTPLNGPIDPPPPMKPKRLIVLETEGWVQLDASTKSAFEKLLQNLQTQGVKLLRRGDHPALELLEQSVNDGRAMCNAIINWENRWTYRNVIDEHPAEVSGYIKSALLQAERMLPEDYQEALKKRRMAQNRHSAIAALADAMISVSCPGPAPPFEPDNPDPLLSRYPTGDFVFNAPSSLLFSPTVTIPLMSVCGMPVGVQLMGQIHQDTQVAAIGRWMTASVESVIPA